MPALPKFPEWLPSEVDIEAWRILSTGTADDDLVLRLATDKRMKEVWKVLRRCKPAPGPHLSEWMRLMSVRVNVPPPEETDALALFF